MNALISKPTDERTTPPELFGIAERRYGPYTLDAFATRQNALCPHFFTKQRSALERRWHGRVFFNPPYSRGWMPIVLDYALCQVRNRWAELATGLVPADTSTAWWHEFVVGRADVCGRTQVTPYGLLIRTEYWSHTTEVLLLEGRWAFNGQPDEAKFGSAFVTYLPPRRARA